MCSSLASADIPELMRTVKEEEHWNKAVTVHVESIQPFNTLLAGVMMLCSPFQELIRD